MTVEQMKRTDLIHSYMMRSDPASPFVTASPTACPYRNTNSTAMSNNLLTPAWTTSVITTARQPQNRRPFSPINPTDPHAYDRLYGPQSPHSTSPTPSSRSSSSPHSTIMRTSPVPNMMELQVDTADSQQPLNLSKRSPSPAPNVIKVEVN